MYLPVNGVLKATIAIVAIAALSGVLLRFSSDRDPDPAIQPNTSEPSQASPPAADLSKVPSGDTRLPGPDRNGELPGANVSEQRSVRSPIDVEVRTPRGDAIRDARVTLALETLGIAEYAATTDAAGMCTFQLPSPAASFVYIKVAATGYSSYLATRDALAAVLENGLPRNRLVIEMNVAAVLSVSVVDEQQLPVPSHLVNLRYLGRGAEPSDSEPPPEGTQASTSGVTDSTGSLRLADLQDGWWFASCDRWRDKMESRQAPLYAHAGQQSVLELKVVSMSRDVYASGTIVIPAPLPALSEFMTIDEYSIVHDGIGPLAHWLYKGGEFFVYGEPQQTLEVRVVAREAAARSKPFSLQIGRHDYRINPSWSD